MMRLVATRTDGSVAMQVLDAPDLSGLGEQAYALVDVVTAVALARDRARDASRRLALTGAMMGLQRCLPGETLTVRRVRAGSTVPVRLQR